MNISEEEKQKTETVWKIINEYPNSLVSIAYRLGMKQKSVELSQSIESLEAEIAGLKRK